MICSDDVYAENKDNLIGSFNRCDRGDTYVDHHVFFCLNSEKTGLNHLSFEVPDIDDVCMGHDYLKETGKYEHMWGIGRHVLGSQVYDYWADPWGRVHEHWADSDRLNLANGSNLIAGRRSAALAMGRAAAGEIHQSRQRLSRHGRPCPGASRSCARRLRRGCRRMASEATPFRTAWPGMTKQEMTRMAKQKITGSFVALITPFNKDGSVDFAAFRSLLTFQEQHGTKAVLIMGSTGETSMLVAGGEEEDHRRDREDEVGEHADLLRLHRQQYRIDHRQRALRPRTTAPTAPSLPRRPISARRKPISSASSSMSPMPPTCRSASTTIRRG